MEYRLLAWPPGPKLRLDHERFAYAGKFVLPSGKAIACEGAVDIPDPHEGYATGILGAVAFTEDRTDGALWLRYVTVREDLRGDGIGPRLCAFTRDRAHDRGYETVRIAVNNPFAYEALYKAGFGFTGRETGLAELVLEHPAPEGRSESRYREGLARFGERDNSAAESTFLESRTGVPSSLDDHGSERE